jgi:hypothetical protein
MANDAFALSPMTASGTLPSETDYEAISEAFMETARGRWFLKEYARRNRNADTAMVLEAVSRVEATIAIQKQQAPTPELAELMEKIRPIIDQAKVLASELIDQLSENETFAPSRRGVRIIREVAWRLREIGYDARICDILESQADAINANHDATGTQETRAAVLASFDRVAQQIGNLVSYGIADPADAAQAAAKSTAPAPADLAEARLARDKSQTAETAPAQPPVALTENVVSLTSAKPTAPALPASAIANLALAGSSIAASVAPRDLDGMAIGAKPEPAITAPAPVIVGTEPEARVDVASESETKSTAASSEAAPPVTTQSLGASLLTRGVVNVIGTGKSDPLAPIKRMTQAEKIAFFS